MSHLQEQVAPRRDDESERLSVAMQKHLECREKWQAVLLRTQEYAMHVRAVDSVNDVRSAYAMMSDQAAMAARETQAQAEEQLKKTRISDV